MTRADFWCRVLGWLQIIGGAATAAIFLFLWNLVLRIFELDGLPAISFLVWMFVIVTALPMFLSGLFTVIFANAVEQAANGLRDQQKVLLRIVMALAGLWSAGIVGMAGLTIPPLGLFGILGLITTGISIMGPDWTADQMKQRETPV